MDFSKYDKRKLLLLLIFSLLVVQTVAAQSNILDTLQNSPALQGITGGSLQDFYDHYWWLVDLIVYSLILGYAIRFGLTKSNAFGNQGNKLGLVIAIVFAVGAVLFEQQQGFRLGNFGPLAFGLGILVIGFSVWKAVGGMGFGENSRVVFSLLYLFIYGFVSKYLQPLRERQDYANLVPTVLDVIAVVMFILLFIGVFSLIGNLFKKGGLGGGGGGGGRGGGRPGNAAVAAAEDQEALAEEVREGQERAAEVREEARELNDIRAIRNLTISENRWYDQIKRAINKMIDILRRMIQSGRESPELVDEVRMKVGEIVQYSSRIRAIEQDLHARIGELEQLGIAEKRKIDQMYMGTRDEIMKEITARKNRGWTGNEPNDEKWTQVKQKFEQDAERRIGEQIATIKSTLETHAVAVGQLERVFADYFTRAEAFLRANDIPRAILQLEAARADIDKIQAGLRALQGNDVDRVQGLIQRRLNDVKAETKTGTLTSIGIRRQVAGARQAQAAAKGLRGIAGKPVTIVGKLFKR